MNTISLICSVIIAWYPTIDGQRTNLPYTEVDYGYLLGISQAPSDLTKITVTLDDVMYFDDYCQGTQDILWVDSGVIEMSDGYKNYTIVPEPATITMILFGAMWNKRKCYYKKGM